MPFTSIKYERNNFINNCCDDALYWNWTKDLWTHFFRCFHARTSVYFTLEHQKRADELYNNHPSELQKMSHTIFFGKCTFLFTWCQKSLNLCGLKICMEIIFICITAPMNNCYEQSLLGIKGWCLGVSSPLSRHCHRRQRSSWNLHRNHCYWSLVEKKRNIVRLHQQYQFMYT